MLGARLGAVAKGELEVFSEEALGAQMELFSS